ncbi:hypothetical protein Patl1_32474 [Pistacia atlantica]|uniref:Uncharacterized protein n=1 Tax=Pistacia atlantica TaxID=434234 RepID=A0ACC1AQP0_9ROSI|nr:hypothetical protein Patl1_32474 [Pistacia atlantica]
MPSSPSPMDSITSTLHHLLNHPTILHFTWSPPLTFTSSPHFLYLTLLTYVSLTFLLSVTSSFSFSFPTSSNLSLLTFLSNFTPLKYSLDVAKWTKEWRKKTFPYSIYVST